MDVREKLVELQSIITCPNAICNFCEHFKNEDACEKHKKEVIADNMIANGVTVQEQDGCEYCNGLPFSQMEDFTMPNASKKDYDIVTIRYCPICGRRLPQPPKGE